MYCWYYKLCTTAFIFLMHDLTFDNFLVDFPESRAYRVVTSVEVIPEMQAAISSDVHSIGTCCCEGESPGAIECAVPNVYSCYIG